MDQYFIYNPSVPTCLINRITRPGKARQGTMAGTRNANGFLITVKRKVWTVQQVIWALHHGEMPPALRIGFRDGNAFNVKIENLFIQSYNTQTRNIVRVNKTGFKGVSQVGRRFSATIKVNGKSTYLGTYETPELASIAYTAAAMAVSKNTI